MLTVTYAQCHTKASYAECHYAECNYAECHYDECHYAECRYAQGHGAFKNAKRVFFSEGRVHFEKNINWLHARGPFYKIL